MSYPTSKANRWEDHYSRKAKKENFPARSVYKLEEIQKKNHLIKKGDKILDLGCFPGSWLLYAAELTGNTGEIIGIDLKPIVIPLPRHVRVYIGDILSPGDDLLHSLGKTSTLSSATWHRTPQETDLWIQPGLSISARQRFPLPGNC